MIQYTLKVLISAVLIVIVSEISKRSSTLGGLLASLPLVSLMAMMWLYIDTGDAGKVAALSKSIFWMVIPSLVFFLILPWLIKTKLNFYLCFSVATVSMVACYGMTLVLLKKLGIES